MSETPNNSLWQRFESKWKNFSTIDACKELGTRTAVAASVYLLFSLLSGTDTPDTAPVDPAEPTPAVAPEVPDLSTQFPTADALAKGPFHIQLPEVQPPKFSTRRPDLKVELYNPDLAPGNSSIDPTLDLESDLLLK